MTRATAAPTDLRVVGPQTLPGRLRHVEQCMGTVFSFQVEAPGIRLDDLAPVLSWLHEMDALFSTYRPDSQVSRIEAGSLAEADADDVVREVLAACRSYRDATDGYFDARADGGRLDPSGYVKGWATQTASDMLLAAGSANHCVNGGGDVICVGQPGPDRPWRIGVADPRNRDAVVRVVSGDGPIAVATSGLAERGAHIVDPHTGRPARQLMSATVVATDLITADVYATAAAAMGADRAAAWLPGRDCTLATLITADGGIRDIACAA